MTNQKHHTLAAAQVLGLFAIAALTVASVTPVRSMELIPSVGVTKSTDTNAGDAQGFAGLALRTTLVPTIKLEGGINYRQDTYLGGALKVRQWPVSASLWFAPVPVLYVGGGVGWYHTTLDFSSSLIKDTTTDKAGVHIGGGLELPIAPKLGLDLNGRYVFMTKDKATFDVPDTFNPDYWTAAIGLALKF